MKIKQKKSLGQVFLTASWPVEKMIAQVRDWGVSRVVEIGPGAGALTLPLLRAGIAVTAVERDDRFAEALINRNEEQLTVVKEDVLEFDLEGWIEAGVGPAAVVGNIPYNITTPIVLWLVPHLSQLKGGMLMTQLEFAQRLASPPGSKVYGSISVYTQLRAKVELGSKVGKELFSPIPRVDSALFTLQDRPHEFSVIQLKRVESLCRAAFSQRRKKIRNGIKAFISKLPEEGFPIDLDRRPGEFSPEEYVALAKFVFPDDF